MPLVADTQSQILANPEPVSSRFHFLSIFRLGDKARESGQVTILLTLAQKSRRIQSYQRPFL